jgi:hypothetical protein
MRHRPATGIWIGAALCTALGLAAVVLATFGTDATSIRRALRVTARFSFLLFWFAYAGGALASLFGPALQAVARCGREFGLAFASAHLVHVGLIIWLYRISLQPPVSNQAFVFFTVGLMWTYLLALLSIKRLSQALGPRRWRILRIIGLEYISFVFLSDFITRPLHGNAKSLLGYLPFSILAVAGTVLRLVAWGRRGGWAARRALPL